MSENKITFPAKLASNNPQSFGIVDATEISGHRRVETLSELYAISDSVLSILKDGSDAIGQEWFVVSEDCKYRLDNWANRKSVAGWTKLPKQELINTKQSVSEKDQPSGYAGLDSNGKIPIEKTYGDTATVTEVETYESLPVTGLSGAIYYVSNTSAQYKWSGSAYIDITDGADNAKKNETSIFDCSNGTSTKYYSSLSAAINIVPPVYRTSNRIISYLSTETATATAVNYQYHGINSTTWTDLTKWERIPSQSDLTEIRSDLRDIEDSFIIEIGKNLFDASKATQHGYINASGEIAYSEGLLLSDKLYLSGRNIVSSVNIDGARQLMPMYYIAEYDANDNFIKTTSSKARLILDDNTAYIIFSISTTHVDFMVEYGENNTSYEPYSKKLMLKEDVLPFDADEINTLKEDIKENNQDLEAFKQYLVSSTTDTVVVPTATLVDKVIPQSGVLTDVSSISGIYKVFQYDLSTYSENENLYVDAVANYKNLFWVITDENGTILNKSIFYSDNNKHYLLNDEVMIPKGAKWLYVQTFVKDNVSRVVYKEANYFTPKVWKDITWGIIGDSLSAYNNRTTKHYFDYISDLTGIKIVNLAVSGSSYGQPQEAGNAFFQQASRLPSNVDVVTIFGSFNTWGVDENGTIEDINTTTKYGCINKAIENIYSINPLARVGIVAPTPWHTNGYNPFISDNGNNWGQRTVDRIKEVCEKRGIPFLDLYHTSELRPWDVEYRKLVYSKEDNPLTAGVHPNEIGHKILSTHFKAFLDKLIISI